MNDQGPPPSLHLPEHHCGVVLGMKSRHGFTLIELLVSLSIITILGLMAVPGTMRAIHRGAVNKGADDLSRVAQQAQLLSKRHVPSGPVETLPHYGIALRPLPSGAVSASVIYGDAANDVWMVNGKPGFTRTLPGNLRLLIGTAEATPTPLAASVVWFYQFGTGRPITSPSDQTPVSIGTRSTPGSSADLVFTGEDKYYSQNLPAIAASPVCSDLQITSSDQRYRVAIAIYEVGLTQCGAL